MGSVEEGLHFAREVGFPVVVRPSFTLGGTGGGIAHDEAELVEVLSRGLTLSPVHTALVEESVLGWKEFELEVMRDHADTVVIITSIENVDPMGVHTGDSITVAPAQTLSDVEYQRMRDAAKAIIREIGVETGGSNIQFAVDPKTGRQVVIEMNPGSPAQAPSPPRPRASPSPRSPPSSPWGTVWTSSPTTSPARPRPPLSPPLTTWW